jgi:hypothetical protein
VRSRSRPTTQHRCCSHDTELAIAKLLSAFVAVPLRGRSPKRYLNCSSSGSGTRLDLTISTFSTITPVQVPRYSVRVFHRLVSCSYRMGALSLSCYSPLVFLSASTAGSATFTSLPIALMTRQTSQIIANFGAHTDLVLSCRLHGSRPTPPG